MNEIKIRHAEASDYPQVISVVNEWWSGRRMADMLPRLFFVHFKDTSLVAERNGGVVGFITGFVSQTFPDEAYIHFIGIHPDFRKAGLARALYERFFEIAANLGCHTVRCVTSPVNTASIAFHQRMGFSARRSDRMIDGVPFFKDYDGNGEDRVLFYRALDVGR